MESILENIKQIRKQKLFTQKDLAEKLGITPAGYNKIESGSNDLSYKMLQQIADVFQMSVVEIISYPNGVNVGSDERVKALESRVKELRDENLGLKGAIGQIDDDLRLIRAFFEEMPLQGYDMDKAYFCALQRKRKGLEEVGAFDLIEKMRWKYKLSMADYMNIVIDQYEKLIAIVRY
jgi:transcriptional regulator with XRE-family HTH domain